MFQTVKNGIVGILNALGYSESSEVESFKDAAAAEYGKTFIIQPLNGELLEPDSETLADRFYDRQTWKIQVAYERSSQNDLINRDEIQVMKDDLIKELDDPANWRSFVRFMKYSSWEMTMTENYFVLTIEVKVQDVITY